MDASLYKTLKTSRGLSYRYWYQPAQSPTHTTLLFLHGFPSTSWDWNRVVARLQPKGYGLLVPDLLGYGGTDKPVEMELYSFDLMANDLDEILQKEDVAKVVAVGHDWGSGMASRLYNYHPERVLALGFLAAPYVEPLKSFDLGFINKMTKEVFGYSTHGYWSLMTREDSHKIITEHIDSFASLLFPYDPETWKTDMGPVGASEAWVLSDKVTPHPSYLTDEEFEQFKATLVENGLAGAMNWYHSVASGMNTAKAKPIPKELAAVTVPVFFAAATKDFVCRPEMGKDVTSRTCKHPETVVRDYAGDHWIYFSHPNEIADDLDAWVEGLKAKNVL